MAPHHHPVRRLLQIHLSRVSEATFSSYCCIGACLPGDAMIFSFDDLSSVTNNFSKDKIIGKGGFGKVYRGRLRHSEVAIKVLNTVSEFY